MTISILYLDNNEHPQHVARNEMVVILDSNFKSLNKQL